MNRLYLILLLIFFFLLLCSLSLSAQVETEEPIYVTEDPTQYHIVVQQDSTTKMTGLYDQEKEEWIIPAKYDYAVWSRPDYPVRPYSDSPYLIVRKGKFQGLFKRNGQMIFPALYQSLSNYKSPDHVWIAKNSDQRFGLLTVNGDTLLPFIHESIYGSDTNIFTAIWQGRELKITADGEIIQPYRWKYPLEYAGKTYYKAEEKGIWGLFDEKGTQILPFQYGQIGFFDRYLKAKKVDAGIGLFDHNLKVKLPFVYEDIQKAYSFDFHFPQPEWIARKPDQAGYAFIDSTGNALGPAVFHFHDRLYLYGDVAVEFFDHGKLMLRARDGTQLLQDTLYVVSPVSIVSETGAQTLKIRKSKEDKQFALYHGGLRRFVTDYEYDSFGRYFTREKGHVPLIQAYKGEEFLLMRPTGKIVSDILFQRANAYTNLGIYKAYFNLPDDPEAEALAFTADGTAYVIYSDDRVVKVGQYKE